MRRASAFWGPACGVLALFMGTAALWASYLPSTLAIVSLEELTLRLEDPLTRSPTTFPVAVGRQGQPLGTFFSGPDPFNREYYLPQRWKPAFHRGLPFLRLGRSEPNPSGEVVRPYGIHGPVTPTLIWGRVTAGCIRMQPQSLQRLFRAARLNPPLEVRVVSHHDRVFTTTRGEVARRSNSASCPEAADGARRLVPITMNSEIRGRVCGAIDHWYSLELRGGDFLSVRLAHGGKLSAELYGIRAISSIAQGMDGFEYLVPRVQKNRGPRYLRLFSPQGQREAIPFTLEVKLVGLTSRAHDYGVQHRAYNGTVITSVQ